jgi:hypothetical protein
VTGRFKKAMKERELDTLVFNVLASFGAMQWVEWYETTKVRRGEKGLGSDTFCIAIKRLMAKKQVRWVKRDRSYRIVRAAAEPKASPIVRDIADLALQQLNGLHS